MPVSGTSFSTKAAFVLDPRPPVVVAAADEREARAGDAGPALGRDPRDLGLRARRRLGERSSLVRVEELDELLEEAPS